MEGTAPEAVTRLGLPTLRACVEACLDASRALLELRPDREMHIDATSV